MQYTAEAITFHSSTPHVRHNSLTKYSCRYYTQENTYLESEARSATNYVAATFHPTIGQCTHQSLSITATYELGMIPQGSREQQQAHT